MRAGRCVERRPLPQRRVQPPAATARTCGAPRGAPRAAWPPPRWHPSTGAHVDAIRLGRRGHLGGELVVTDAAHVRGRARHLQHPLSDADGVLRSAAGDVLNAGLGRQLLGAGGGREGGGVSGTGARGSRGGGSPAQQRASACCAGRPPAAASSAAASAGGQAAARARRTWYMGRCLSSARIWLAGCSCCGGTGARGFGGGGTVSGEAACARGAGARCMRRAAEGRGEVAACRGARYA